ncbi:MAG: hypothetical protein GY782_09945 [Gammaproteobacteria bacterium]|nr:hypothetical protein [Gammaproteobacteria bacterium]
MVVSDLPEKLGDGFRSKTLDADTIIWQIYQTYWVFVSQGILFINPTKGVISGYLPKVCCEGDKLYYNYSSYHVVWLFFLRNQANFKLNGLNSDGEGELS